MMKNDELLTKLPNIGLSLAKELNSIGVFRAEQLKQIGSAEALFAIRGTSGKGCMNMLYALEGAIRNIRWHHLTDKEKLEAKNAFYKLLE